MIEQTPKEEAPSKRRRSRRTRRSLNELPDDAIDEILCLLPIKFAVRTSILSKFWRHRWKSIPVLDVSLSCPSQIYKVLLQHSSPIRLFKAQYNVLPAKETEIYDWFWTLRAGSKSTLHTLILSMFGCLDVGIIACWFPNLVQLELECSSLFVFSNFSGFAHVRSLHLRGAGFGTVGHTRLGTLISACPLLETLILNGLDGKLQSVELNAPNLRTLKINRVDFRYFKITGAPSLQRATICVCKCVVEDDDSLLKGIEGLASVQKLRLDQSMLEYFGTSNLPERTKISFIHLKVLSLHVALGGLKALRVVRCILRGSPNLQELRIKHFKYYYGCSLFRDNFWETCEHEDLFDKLEKVKMTQISCNRLELDFIKFLLAKARVLKRLMITYRRITDKDLVRAEILAFPRTSSQAKILYRKG